MCVQKWVPLGLKRICAKTSADPVNGAIFSSRSAIGFQEKESISPDIRS
jgi:hypothetical protein